MRDAGESFRDFAAAMIQLCSACPGIALCLGKMLGIARVLGNSGPRGRGWESA
jgi:hypothetical protein